MDIEKRRKKERKAAKALCNSSELFLFVENC